MISINIEKARKITKDRLRAEREPLLARNDKEYIVAIKDGLDTEPLLDERQRLLDITELVNKAKTIEELKKIKVE